MDEAALIAKAREYVSLEEHEFFRTQVQGLIEKHSFEELNDRFFTELAFGTGGLRGVIGGGYNRMNPYTVKKATQGLANYIKKNVRDIATASVVIAYDCRNFSDQFSLDAALVLAASGIRTYLFTSLRPTPELSFAVRHLKTTAGIVVTASHNPPEYNGYKVYWSDGGQIVPPHDSGIIAEARALSGAVHGLTKEEALQRGLLVMIDREVDEPFIAMVKGQSLRPDLVKAQGKTLSVVYTPLNGAGAVPVERVLAELGIRVTFVPEQQHPDGNFPTVKFPNPEEASAMQLALDLGKARHADLVLGTDPDADRLGIAAPDGDSYRLITGNQLGVLLLDYILTTRKELGTLPKKGAFIKTIVTTELERLVAEKFGLMVFDVLTGFKYIGEKIRQFESQPDGPVFLFGNEESYGYLTTSAVRDKDAVSGAVMTAELTLYQRSLGKTLMDRLRELWNEFGYFKETGVSGVFKGEAGIASMKKLMETLRNAPPAEIGGLRIAKIKDYLTGTTAAAGAGAVKDLDLPASNVLQFFLEDGSVVTARPSGTEPKIKFYVSCRSAAGLPLDIAIADVERKSSAIIAQVKKRIDEA